jgi:hypothetical protein
MENTVEAEGYGARGRRRLSTTRRCSCYLNFIFFLVCPAYVCICMYEIERASERESARERESERARDSENTYVSGSPDQAQATKLFPTNMMLIKLLSAPYKYEC